MANIVEVIFKATDQTGSVFSSIKSKFSSTKISFTELNQASELLQKGIQAVTRIINETITKNDEYVNSIVDVARYTGNEVEELSRLTQVADDFFLSQEKLNQSLSIGAKKGLDMSVEGIMKLADEYNSLSSAQEKAELLNENFGRSGLDMGKLLENGAAGIEKAMRAIDSGLVVTQKGVENNIKYKQSVDQINDAQDAFSYTIANAALPGVTAINENWAAFLTTLSESDTVINGVVWALDTLAGAIEAARDLMTFDQQMNDLISAHGRRMALAGTDYETYTKAVLDTAVANGLMTKKTRELYDLYADNTDKMSVIWIRNQNKELGILEESYYNLIPAIDAMRSTTEIPEPAYIAYMRDGISAIGEQAELTTEEIDAMNAAIEAETKLSQTMISITENMTGINKSYEDGLSDLQEQLDDGKITQEEFKDGVKKLADETQLATRRIILSYTEQLLAADGLTQEEANYLLKMGEDWGIYADGAAAEAQKVMETAAKLKEALETGIPSYKKITIETEYITIGSSGGTSGQYGAGIGVTEKKLNKDLNGNSIIGFATGGSFVIPAGYGYEGFNMGGVATASAGETVNISRGDNMAELLAEMQEVRRGLASLPRELSAAILERAGQIGIS